MQALGRTGSRQACGLIKKYALVFPLLVLLGATSVYGGKLKALQEQVSEVKGEVDAVRTEVEVLQENLSAFGDDVYAAFGDEINELKELIATLEDEQEATNQKVEALLAQFRDLAEQHRDLLEALEAAQRPPVRDPLQGAWEKKAFLGLAAITLIFGDSGNFLVEGEVALGKPEVGSGTWKRSGQEVTINIERASKDGAFKAGEEVRFEILSIEGDILVLDDGTEPFTLKRVRVDNE